MTQERRAVGADIQIKGKKAIQVILLKVASCLNPSKETDLELAKK